MIDTRNSAAGEAGIGLPSKKSMIYVVDDDYDVRTSLRFLLETEGFDVRTFRSGVDYKMAELDGLELAYRLRRLDVSTPIILITGYPDENIAAKASSAGVRQVLLKPNLEDNLVDCVRNAIDAPDAAGQP